MRPLAALTSNVAGYSDMIDSLIMSNAIPFGDAFLAKVAFNMLAEPTLSMVGSVNPGRRGAPWNDEKQGFAWKHIHPTRRAVPSVTHHRPALTHTRKLSRPEVMQIQGWTPEEAKRFIFPQRDNQGYQHTENTRQNIIDTQLGNTLNPNIMENILLVINIILAFILVIFVLFQKSEGGALGIGVSQDNFMFSRSAGNFFTKATAIIATLFIICSLALTIVSRGDLTPTSSVLDKIEENSDEAPKIPENNN